MCSGVTFIFINTTSLEGCHMKKRCPKSFIWLCIFSSPLSLTCTLISTGISPRLLLLECSKCSLLMHVRASFFHLQHLIYRPVVPLILCRAISSAPQIALSKPPLPQIKRKVITIVGLLIYQCCPPFSWRPQIKGLSCPCAPLITGLVSLCEWTPGLLHFHPQIGFQSEPPRAGLLADDPHTLLSSALLHLSYSGLTSNLTYMLFLRPPLVIGHEEYSTFASIAPWWIQSFSLLRRSDPQVC